MNWAKSEIFYGSSISNKRIDRLYQVMAMRKGSLPFIYLGVPLFFGAPKKLA